MLGAHPLGSLPVSTLQDFPPGMARLPYTPGATKEFLEAATIEPVFVVHLRPQTTGRGS